MVIVIVWFGLDLRIHVYCLECAMPMLIWLFFIFLVCSGCRIHIGFQFGQHINYYMFYILIYICR
jgi:hypothetical protein